LESRSQQLKRDGEKFKAILGRHESRRRRLEQNIEDEKAELANGGDFQLKI